MGVGFFFFLLVILRLQGENDLLVVKTVALPWTLARLLLGHT